MSNPMDFDVPHQILLIGLLIRLLLDALDWQSTKLDGVLGNGQFIT
jgi:hypothetical protein